MLEQARKWLRAGLIAIGIAAFVRYFIFIPVQIEGISMKPTLQPGEQVLYEPFTKIKRFDIILFHDQKGEAYIKRVIGLPGEKLSYQKDQLFIDGRAIEEPFLRGRNSVEKQLFTPDFDLESITDSETVPDDAYFVLGDNRIRSKDSRMFGFVPKKSIEGKARAVIFPFDRIALLSPFK